MEYNSTREKLDFPEYGRNVQKMVEFIMTIEDREMRNQAARQVVAVMGQLTNAPKEGGDFRHKLWDHLFMISDYKLDVDSPFSRPEKPEEPKLPQKPSYPHNRINYRQYGKSVELMIAKTIEYEDGIEKETLTRYIANHLKKMYLNWNRESVQDDLIGKHLEMMSDGKLALAHDTQLEATPDLIVRTKKKKFTPGAGKQNNNHKNYSRYGRKNQRKSPM